MSAAPRVVVTPAVLRDRPLPDHGEGTTKHARGRVLVVGGTAETPGAVLLAGVAALRAGAGTVQLATAATAASGLAIAVPEARVIGIDGEEPGDFDHSAVDKLQPLLDKADAVLVGPGTFAPEATAGLVRAAVDALRATDGRLILDAGSLPLLQDEPSLLAPLGARAVAMPNPSEMALLLDIEEDTVDDDPEGVLRRAVERLGCVVTLRGAETWSAGPDTPPYLDQSGTSGLATSGSGDVLAGLIAGYAARGAEALDAVLWATHVHGAAATRCAAVTGDVGFLARELLDEIGPTHLMLGA